MPANEARKCLKATEMKYHGGTEVGWFLIGKSLKRLRIKINNQIIHNHHALKSALFKFTLYSTYQNTVFHLIPSALNRNSANLYKICRTGRL